jgi:hypothetical protein
MSEPRVDVLRNGPRMTTALLHIGMHPGASNRLLAAGIGIGDEAQSSRLLAHMRDLGLIVNGAHRRGVIPMMVLFEAGRRCPVAHKDAPMRARRAPEDWRSRAHRSDGRLC